MTFHAYALDAESRTIDQANGCTIAINRLFDEPPSPIRSLKFARLHGREQQAYRHIPCWVCGLWKTAQVHRMRRR